MQSFCDTQYEFHADSAAVLICLAPPQLLFALQSVEISCVAFNQVAAKLHPLFEEGRQYTITYGNVKEADPNYPSNHSCEIHFNEATTVSRNEEEGTEYLNGLGTGEILFHCLACHFHIPIAAMRLLNFNLRKPMSSCGYCTQFTYGTWHLLYSVNNLSG